MVADVRYRSLAEQWIVAWTLQTPNVTAPVAQALRRAITEDSLEEARKLDESGYQSVINGIAHFTALLYKMGIHELEAYGKHYALVLIKEVVRTESKTAMVQTMKIIRGLDYDAFEMALAHLPKDVRQSVLTSEKVARVITDAIRGSIVGALIAFVLILARQWLG